MYSDIASRHGLLTSDRCDRRRLLLVILSQQELNASFHETWQQQGSEGRKQLSWRLFLGTTLGNRSGTERESHLLLLCLKRRRRRWKPWGPDGPRIPLVGHLLAPTFSLSLHFLYLSLSFPPSSSSYLRIKRRHLLTCFETKKFKPLNYIFWRTGENRLFWSFSSSSFFFLFFFWSFQWCGPRFFVLPNWKNTFDSETFIYILCSHCIIIDSLPTWPNLINYDDELALFFLFFFFFQSIAGHVKNTLGVACCLNNFYWDKSWSLGQR